MSDITKEIEKRRTFAIISLETGINVYILTY